MSSETVLGSGKYILVGDVLIQLSNGKYFEGD